MNEKEELAKNTAILTVGKVCTQLISFLLLPLYTASLNTEEYGIVDLLSSYTMLFMPLINWQFDNGAFRFLIDTRSDEKRKKIVVSTTFYSNVIQCACFAGLFIVFSGFIHTEYKYFLLFDTIVNVFLSLFLQFSRGVGENTKYAIGSFLSASITVVLNVLYIAFLKLGPLGMFLATVEAKSISMLYLFISNKIWKYLSYRDIKKYQFNNLCNYSLPLIPNQLSWWILNTSDRSVITYFISLSAEGIYAVANKISSAYSTVSNIVYLAFSESVTVHFNDDNSQSFINDTINSLFGLFASFIFCIIGIMPVVFNIIIDTQYKDAYYHIPILLIGAFFQSLVGLYSAIYVALKKSVEIAKSTIISAIINLVIDLLMVKRIAIYAGSVSTLISFLAVAIYRGISIRKYMKIRISSKNIIICFFVIVFLLPIYYIQNTYLSIIGFLGSVLVSLYINKSFITFLIHYTKNKLKNR